MNRKIRKSGPNNSDGSPGGGWEIIYSGFVLILLSFFIMLSSFSTMEAAKVMRFVKSFVSAVSILPAGTKFETGTVALLGEADMVDVRKDLAKIFNNLDELAQQFHLQDEISLAFTHEGLVMRLSEHALFDLGEADIAVEALPLLDKIGAIISKTGYLIRIEGHTDNLPIHTALFPSNWELSTARAVNVLRYFIKNHHIDPRRLAAEGFGEFHPLVSNDSPENRAKNRRVEIIFIHKEATQPLVEKIP
jgi:chemotaxis protein MotB